MREQIAPATGVPHPPVKGLHHVGVVVDSLDDALGFLTGVLGLELLFRAARGDEAVAFIRCGAVRLELIELSDPEERTRRLGGDQARIDHLALEVADLDGLAGLLEESGVRFDGEALDRGLGPMRFTDADTTDGVVYQLLELRPRET